MGGVKKRKQSRYKQHKINISNTSDTKEILTHFCLSPLMQKRVKISLKVRHRTHTLYERGKKKGSIYREKKPSCTCKHRIILIQSFMYKCLALERKRQKDRHEDRLISWLEMYNTCKSRCYLMRQRYMKWDRVEWVGQYKVRYLTAISLLS